MHLNSSPSLRPSVSVSVSVQAQHSHHVIQQVLNHLDTHNRNTPRARAGIVQVLLETVAIAAKGSVGELQDHPGSPLLNCQAFVQTFSRLIDLSTEKNNTNNQLIVTVIYQTFSASANLKICSFFSVLYHRESE